MLLAAPYPLTLHMGEFAWVQPGLLRSRTPGQFRHLASIVCKARQLCATSRGATSRGIGHRKRSKPWPNAQKSEFACLEQNILNSQCSGGYFHYARLEFKKQYHCVLLCGSNLSRGQCGHDGTKKCKPESAVDGHSSSSQAQRLHLSSHFTRSGGLPLPESAATAVVVQSLKSEW